MFSSLLVFSEGKKEGAAFPSKPVKLIVYTKPGGIVAMKYIIESTEADGYTFFFIFFFMVSGSELNRPNICYAR